MPSLTGTKIWKGLSRFLIVNLLLYVTACFVLIYWPLPTKKAIENYDYSSIKTHSKAAFAAQKQWIKVSDGDSLFCRVYPSQSKDVVLLLHGSGTESRYLKRLAISLAEANVGTVLTPDLRGHGENGGPRGDIDYIGQLEGDITKLIAYSKRHMGAQKIILAGHSSGGGLVLRYIGNPQNTTVDKAILLAPYLGHQSPTVKPNSGNWVTVAIKRWVGLSMVNRLGISGLDGLPVLFFNRPAAYTDPLQVPFYSYRMAVNFAPNDYQEDISAITIPTLVLVGGKDESFYPEQFKPVFAPAKKRVSTAILTEANHLDIVSRQETTTRIVQWMAR